MLWEKTAARPDMRAATIQVISRRSAPWAILGALALGVIIMLIAMFALARPWTAQIDVGGPRDAPYLRGFYPRENSDAESFRWSQGEAFITLPGVGAAPVEVRLLGKAPGEVVRIDAGAGATDLALQSGWQRIRLLPRPPPWSDDVQLRITAPTVSIGDDPRRLGVVLDQIRLQSTGGAPIGLTAGIGLVAALTALMTGRYTHCAWLGGLGGAALGLGIVAALLVNDGAGRLLLTSYTGRLALTLALGGALAISVERGLASLTQRGILTLRPALVRWIAAAALLAFLLRFGAMAYPTTVPIDLQFSLARATMVRDGQFLSLFLPNPSLTPTQWEVDGPIPRSPLYYLLTAPLTYLPEDGAALALMAFSSIIDALAVVLVAVLVIRAGAGGRAAAMAGALAGMLPLGLMMAVAWGVFPTLLAQFLALLALVVWLFLHPRLHERRALLTFAGTLTLAYLAYPTALMFLGLTWLLLVALLMLTRDPATKPTFVAGLLAAGAATILFYGWHIPALFTRTLPAMFGPSGEGSGGGNTITFGEMWSTIQHPLIVHHGPSALILAGGGLALLLTRRSNYRTHANVLIGAWLLAYIPLALANGFVVTLILKHLLYVLPVTALLGGLLLGKLAQRPAGRLLAAALLTFVFWQGMIEVFEHLG
jgi:hypothetical protein